MPDLAIVESLSVAEIVWLAVAAFAGSVTAGLSGMGGGMLLAVAVAPVVGIDALIPVMTVAMFLNHIARVMAFGADAKWDTAGKVMITALPLTVLGATVYSALPVDIVAIVIGCFVLVFVPGRRLLGDAAWNVSTPGLLGVGSVFGFVSGTAIGAGMLIIPVLLGSGLTGAALIGTDAVIGLAVLIVKGITFGTLSVLTVQLAVFGVAVGIFAMPGVWLARWIIKHSSVRVHTLFIELVLLAGGASFVWRGLTH